MPKEEIDRKILKNAKDLDFHEAVYSAFPDAKRDEKFGVTACGTISSYRKSCRSKIPGYVSSRWVQIPPPAL